jgi:hypothetical protein
MLWYFIWVLPSVPELISHLHLTFTNEKKEIIFFPSSIAFWRHGWVSPIGWLFPMIPFPDRLCSPLAVGYIHQISRARFVADFYNVSFVWYEWALYLMTSWSATAYAAKSAQICLKLPKFAQRQLVYKTLKFHQNFIFW